MDFVRGVVRDAATHLQPPGLLVLEIGHERAYFDAAFPTLDVVGLPTSEGDEAVLLITRDALLGQ
jgi:ribosomal protein L3 glutamine methyltransferase